MHARKIGPRAGVTDDVGMGLKYHDVFDCTLGLVDHCHLLMLCTIRCLRQYGIGRAKQNSDGQHVHNCICMSLQTDSTLQQRTHHDGKEPGELGGAGLPYNCPKGNHG